MTERCHPISGWDSTTRGLCGWTLKARRPGDVRREAAGIGDNSPDRGYLDGQLLIAMPVMGDPRFERSVIYLCAHSSEGAMGIIVNRPAGSIDFPELLVQLDIIKKPTRSSCRKTPRA